MKQFVYIFLSLVTLTPFVHAQINVTGTVKNEKGIFLPFVFVQEKQIKSGTFTDSAGNFNIKVNPNASLLFSLKGYADTTINVNADENLMIVLRNDGSLKNNSSAANRNLNQDVLVSDAFSGHMNTVSSYNTAYNEGGQMQFNGSTFAIAREKEETHGSRYYYKDWAKGYVINNRKQKISNPSLLFNYNKVTGDLLLTHDKKTAIIVDRDQINSFTLYDAIDREHTFEMIPQIDKVHFAEVLVNGDKYKLYKLTKTKFMPSNFTTNGIVSSGNSYDEYADGNIYYLISADGQIQKLEMKQKTIKRAFEKDEKKLQEFLSNNNSREIDESFLKDMVIYMNN